MGRRMTKAMLEDYKRKKASIPLLRAELHEMYEGDNGLGNSVILNGKDGGKKPESVVGFDWNLRSKKEMHLMNVEADCKFVETWIREIEDDMTREVFKSYYLDGMKWEKVSKKTKYGGKKDNIRKTIRDGYLKKCGIY